MTIRCSFYAMAAVNEIIIIILYALVFGSNVDYKLDYCLVTAICHWWFMLCKFARKWQCFEEKCLEYNVHLQCLTVCLAYSGQLRIPSHISVLHVEQEVVGDDTPALESVLQCDALREELLSKEREISVSINKGYVFAQKSETWYT